MALGHSRVIVDGDLDGIALVQQRRKAHQPLATGGLQFQQLGQRSEVPAGVALAGTHDGVGSSRPAALGTPCLCPLGCFSGGCLACLRGRSRFLGSAPAHLRGNARELALEGGLGLRAVGCLQLGQVARDGQHPTVLVDQPEVHLQVGGNVLQPEIGGCQPPAALDAQEFQECIDERRSGRDEDVAVAESGFCRRGIGFTGLCLAGAQAIEKFGRRAIERQQVAAPALRQRLEEQRDLLGQHAGHQPFAAIGIDLVERMQRHGERDAIIGRTGLEVIGQREVDTPHAQQARKARLVHAVGILLQQCLTRELQQSGIGLDGLAVPLLEVARIADPGGHLGIEPGCQRLLVDQQVGTADLVLQPLDIGDDLAVVADEVGIDGPFAGDQAVTNHQSSGFSRIDLFVGHAPGGVEH